MKVAWIGIVTALLATMALALPAQAQYPPPGGDVTISPSDATPSVGETITLNIVVSEETGIISLASEGNLTRGLDATSLYNRLLDLLEVGRQQAESYGVFDRIVKRKRVEKNSA